MTLAWLAPILRMARREARRHPVRSALIVALVALPVVGGTSADLLARGSSLSPSERATRVLGNATAIVQRHRGPESAVANATSVSDDTNRLRAAIGASAQVLAFRAGLLATIRTPSGAAAVTFDEVDYSVPLARGLYRQIRGRAPHTATEVAVSPALATIANVRVGQHLVIEAPTAQRVTVVGIAVRPDDTRGLYAVAGAVGAIAGGWSTVPPQWLVSSSGGISPSIVSSIGHSDFVVGQTRRAILRAPTHSNTLRVVFAIAVSVTEIAVIVGAAFSIGARRSRRELGLFIATGADGRQVGLIVVGSGLFLGAAGAALGLAIGVGIAIVARPHVETATGVLYGGWHVHIGEVLGIALVGFVASLVASIIPARWAARLSVVAALSRGVERPTRIWRWLWLGVVTMAIATGMVVAGVQGRGRLPLVVAGSVMADAGLIACCPAAIRALGVLGRAFPLSVRWGLRTAARYHARSAVTIAAIAVGIAGSVAASFAFASNEASARAAYTPLLRVGQVALTDNSTGDTTTITAGVVRDVSARLPTALAGTYSALEACSNGPKCPNVRLSEPAGRRCADDQGSCRYPATTVAVGGPEAVRLVSGRLDLDEKNVQASLDAGDAVVFDPSMTRDGHVVITVTPQVSTASTPSVNGPPPLREIELAADVIRAHVPVGLPGVILSPKTVANLRVPGLLVEQGIIDTTRMPTSTEEQQARQVLLERSPSLFLTLEKGYHGNPKPTELTLLLVSVFITLTAPVVATALALADGYADLATLAAVGASPNLRRVFAASHACSLAMVGAVIGLVAAAAPSSALLITQGSRALAIPWSALGVVVLGAPTAAALAAVVFTRTRLPLTRRIT